MKLNIKPFRQAHEKSVQDIYRSAGIDAISLYCTVSLCPVIAAYWYCREIDPENQELTRRIENVKLFYGVEEVRDD